MKPLAEINKVITYLPSVMNYEDRIHQLNNSCDYQNNIQIFIFTKSLGIKKNQIISKKFHKINFEFLENKLSNKSIFLQFKIGRYLYNLKDNFLLLDWFANFFLIGLLLKLSKNNHYVFSPVISSWGWIYKQFKFEVPIFSFRYTWFRLISVPTELISIFSANIVVVQSVKLKKFYSRVYGIKSEKIIVNYNYTSLKPKNANPKKLHKKLVIGYIGNFEKHKGNRIIYEIANQSKFNLILAGSSKGYKNIKLLEKVKSLKNVDFVGKLDREGVNLFYNSIDVLILPSYHEGSPRVVTEFLSFRKPIISFNNPGLDYCGKNSLVFLLDYFQDHKDFLKILRRINNNEFNKIEKCTNKINPKYALFN
ncbi:MAG: hypothetical protein CL832_09250 [Crocinitomicaceae bacterium]|nr:hypothetical protein [Crocinitomicaceae bacterium]|tara:strand:- start:4247 stop:5341 length:1095 start_codon:yes stop_codon:yes gene_type:complete